MLPAACALTGGAVLLLTLVLFPGYFSVAHALAVGGNALVLTAFLLRDRPSIPESEKHPAGNLSALSALSENLQERIERLQDLQWQVSERETRYRALLDAQSNLILRVDHKRRLTFANRAYCALFGVEADDVLGRPFSPEVVSGNSCLVDRTWPLANAADCRPFEQLLATPHGERWISWRIHELAPDGSGLFEYELVGRDVTLERAQEANLEAARHQAETANRAKSRFLAAMSHEIRTPMNGILGMTGLLCETKLSEEQQTYVSAIEQSASTLLGLIDEILDFSKIEAGKLTIKEERFSIPDCVRSTVELLAPSAHEKGLELAWRMEPDVPEHLFGDMSRVRQIALNLLSNAIKFTEKGGVEVTIAAAEPRTGAQHSEGSRRISITVRDTGIGLSDEDATTLFEEFEQSKATADSQSGGTGLGLAISRGLARAMGGDIRVVSRPGEGSAFTAELDLRDARGEELAVIADRREVMRRHVLLATDRLIERSALARILSDNGALAVEVSSGAAFEAITTALQRGEGFDCIIVDCALPPEDAQKLYEHA
jgi:PAS domain S-box-containing protein